MQNLTSTELHEMVTQTADSVWLRFRKVYPKLPIIRPIIKYNNRLKTTAGRAFIWNNPPYTDISVEMAYEHGQKFISWVIEHETGHHVAFILFKASGHCEVWKTVMRSINASDARLHTFGNTKHETNKLMKLCK